jgi:hypothetical protein
MSRRLCGCGHRYADHAERQCLAVVDDPDNGTRQCWCHEYEERPSHRHATPADEALALALADTFRRGRMSDHRKIAGRILANLPPGWSLTKRVYR